VNAHPQAINRMYELRRLLSIALVTAFTGCAVAPSHDERALPYTPGLDVTAMDRSIDPCDDFYQYACGGWQKRNPIPPDHSSWDVYVKMYEENLSFLRTILDSAATEKRRDPETQKIGDYHAACMDEQGVEQRGLEPLSRNLAAIAGIGSPLDIGPVVARLQRGTARDDVLFEVGAEQDPDDAEREIASLDQGGLGLPDRDYYLRDDPKSREARERYEAHIAKILVLLGDRPEAAKASATRIMTLETALARVSLRKVERRDPYKTRHKLARAGLESLAPDFAWDAYFKALGMPGFDVVNVRTPAFFSELSERLASEPLSTWKDYLRFHLADNRAAFLSSAFVAEDFDFHLRYLTGAQELQPRWRRCVRLVDEQLGEALGRAYVQKAFTPELKMQVLAMVQRIESAMERRLRTEPWMSESTRRAAIEKLHAMRNKIGYPDKWRDYSSVAIARDDFMGNVQRAAAFELDRQLAKIGRPVDRNEWWMTPPTVNAYFGGQTNDINFPAGILQPPLYDPKMDAAPNYGDTGGTIGHELTHGFDDTGRLYDARGNLRNWWTQDDERRFIERAKCLVDQYAAYTAVDDVNVDGLLTLSENIADLGGEMLAYEAWKDAGKDQKPADRDGLTADQRFFVGFAQWACENIRPERARELALTDDHAPSKDRINGVVVNMPEFAKAFSCKVGTPMTKAPEKLCSVW